MTDLDRDRLDHILPSVSAAADWDDVIRRSRARHARLRRRLVVVAVATLVVAGTASAFGTVRDFIIQRGFVGLPPEGATPSTPENGKLVLSYFGPGTGHADHGKSRFWLYADGRLISLRSAKLPEGANELSTGLLEQHLTSQGVELLRSKKTSTGLVGPNDLVGLPARAWKDRKVTAYVPSRYAVCYDGWTKSKQPVEASRVLNLLPPAAANLLRGRDRTRHDGLRGYGGDLRPDYHYCSNMTPEDARSLAKALDNPAFERTEPAYWLAFETRGPNRETIDVWFDPILPHGANVCPPCG